MPYQGVILVTRIPAVQRGMVRFESRSRMLTPSGVDSSSPEDDETVPPITGRQEVPWSGWLETCALRFSRSTWRWAAARTVRVAARPSEPPGRLIATRCLRVDARSANAVIRVTGPDSANTTSGPRPLADDLPAVHPVRWSRHRSPYCSKGVCPGVPGARNNRFTVRGDFCCLSVFTWPIRSC